MSSTVSITRRGEARLRSGHPWIYRGDLGRIEAAGGDVVAVTSSRGARLGHALYSDRSKIALRVIARGEGPLDEGFLRGGIARAIARRAALAIDADAYRLVHAEGDGLPSLIVDRYGPILVVQALSQGMDRLLPTILDALEDALRPEGILTRHDVRARSLEGLPLGVATLRGRVPERLVVREGPIALEVDLQGDQKTGLFLDQRDNHARAAELARGRALDLFSYHGGFALRLATRADSVTAVESSRAAADRIGANARRNALGNVEVVVANAFDWLRGADERRERFDTIVLDPPAFAKSRDTVDRALRGYKELNLRAMRLLRPGGTLVTSSCSHHVDEGSFGRMLAEAAGDVGASMILLERRGQALDHPVVLGIPETGYLKCWILLRRD